MSTVSVGLVCAGFVNEFLVSEFAQGSSDLSGNTDFDPDLLALSNRSPL